MYNLVSLTGVSGSGKDSAGEYLAQNYGYHKLSWASALRTNIALSNSKFYREDYLLDFVEADKEWEKVTGFMDVLLNLPERIKLDAYELSKNKIVNSLKVGKNVVITDTRFPREYQYIKEYSAWGREDVKVALIKIDCEKSCRILQKFDNLLDFQSFKYIINNDYTSKFYHNLDCCLRLKPVSQI